MFFVKYLNSFFGGTIEVKINLKDLDHHDYAKQIVAAL